MKAGNRSAAFLHAGKLCLHIPFLTGYGLKPATLAQWSLLDISMAAGI